MKKRWIIAAACMLFLSGCAKEKKTVPIPEATSTATQQVKDVVFKGISFKVEMVSVGKTIKGKFIISNTESKSIPFYISDGTLITYQVRDDSGVILTKGSTKEEVRKELQAKEEISYPFEASIIDSKSNLITVDAKLNLVNKTHEKYTSSELRTDAQVQIPTEFVYLPSQPVTYTYINPEHEEAQRETYAYIENGRVQKNSEITGVSVYTEDQDGVYLAYNDSELIELNTKNLLSSLSYGEKQKILALPVKKGKKWISGSNSYEIMDTTETVVTPAGTYKDVVEVKMMNKNEIRLYYAKGVGLIEVGIVSENGVNPVQILQIIE